MARRRTLEVFTRSRHLTPLLVVAALASAGAAVVHAAVAPEHTNWGASVTFFVALAVFQIGWAGALLVRRPGPAVLAFGVAVNLLALAIWAVSRISGLPFGPHRGQAEPAARADVIASALGMVVVLGAVGIARQWGGRPVARLRSALSMGAGGLAVSAIAVFALTGVSGHGHLAEGEHDHASPLEVQAAASTRDLDSAAAYCRRTAGNAGHPAGDGAARAVGVDAPHPDDGHAH